MPSLVLLMIEAEQPEGISSRKLVIETVKHNVITAYTVSTGLELLRRFPNVDGILLHTAVLDGHHDLIPELKKLAPGRPVIVSCPSPDTDIPEADYTVESHSPQQLLDLIARIFGISKRTDSE